MARRGAIIRLRLKKGVEELGGAKGGSSNLGGGGRKEKIIVKASIQAADSGISNCMAAKTSSKRMGMAASKHRRAAWASKLMGGMADISMKRRGGMAWHQRRISRA